MANLVTLPGKWCVRVKTDAFQYCIGHQAALILRAIFHSFNIAREPTSDLVMRREYILFEIVQYVYLKVIFF